MIHTQSAVTRGVVAVATSAMLRGVSTAVIGCAGAVSLGLTGGGIVGSAAAAPAPSVAPSAPAAPVSEASAPAAAQAPKVWTDEFFITPAPDVQKYYKELNITYAVYKVRESFALAATGQLNGAAKGGDVEPMKLAEAKSSDAASWAKARFMLSLLRAEGNSAARELDLNKVGVDKAETEKAAKVLDEGHADVREHTLNPVGVEGQRTNKGARLQKNDEALTFLKSVRDQLGKGDQQSLEYDAQSVINWGVAQHFVHHTQRELKLPREYQRLEVVNAAGAKSVERTAAVDNGNANRKVLDSDAALNARPYPNGFGK